MPVLLLCRGDKEAKDLLRMAIEARYGPSPPVIDSLRIQFKGRARAKLGPISTWIPVDASAHFQFPTHLRWDFTVKPLKLPVRKGIETFDGESFHSIGRGGDPTIIDDPDLVTSMRRRLWAITAILLTPISDMSVEVTATNARSFDAENKKLEDSVSLFLRENDTLEYAKVLCLNPDTEKEQTFTLRLSDEQQQVDGLMLPTKISAFWDDNPYFEMKPVKVELNPTIPLEEFTLETEG